MKADPLQHVPSSRTYGFSTSLVVSLHSHFASNFGVLACHFCSAGNSSHVGSFAFELVTLKDANGQQLPPIVFLAAGARHALLVAQDLRLWAFGDNLAGQCGVPGHQTKLNTPKVGTALRLVLFWGFLNTGEWLGPTGNNRRS